MHCAQQYKRMPSGHASLAFLARSGENDSEACEEGPPGLYKAMGDN